MASTLSGTTQPLQNPNLNLISGPGSETAPNAIPNSANEGFQTAPIAFFNELESFMMKHRGAPNPDDGVWYTYLFSKTVLPEKSPLTDIRRYLLVPGTSRES